MEDFRRMEHLRWWHLVRRRLDGHMVMVLLAGTPTVMAWQLSRYRAGNLVRVRQQAEILATLDEFGCVDGMPFMPEMLRFCGSVLRVSAVAHKTCDPALKTWGRSLDRTVHLTDARCDGAAHGGCQADCNLFWKDVWLERLDEESD